MANGKVNTIWRNNDFSQKYTDAMKEAYLEELELNGGDISEEISDEALFEFIGEHEGMWLGDEYINLSHVGEDSVGFLLVADLGLWNGRFNGYSEAKTIKDAILKSMGSCDYAHVYVEDGKMCVTGSHHDGTNHVEIRAWRKDVSGEAMDRVKDAIYGSKPNAENLIRRHTRSLGKDVAKVYGW